MDFQLPAVTRYLADTGGDGSGAVAVGSLRESLPRSKTAEVTTMLSEQMYATSPPTRVGGIDCRHRGGAPESGTRGLGTRDAEGKTSSGTVPAATRW